MALKLPFRACTVVVVEDLVSLIRFYACIHFLITPSTLKGLPLVSYSCSGLTIVLWNIQARDGVGEDITSTVVILKQKATTAVIDLCPDGGFGSEYSAGTHQIRLAPGQGGGRVLCPHQHQPTDWPHCFTDLYPP